MGGESFQGFELGDGVEAVLDKDDFRQGDLGEVGALGEPKADEAVGVLDGAFLPGGVGVGVVDGARRMRSRAGWSRNSQPWPFASGSGALRSVVMVRIARRAPSATRRRRARWTAFRLMACRGRRRT